MLQREYADDDTVYQLKIKVSQTTPPALRLLHPHLTSTVQGVILSRATKQNVLMITYPIQYLQLIYFLFFIFFTVYGIILCFVLLQDLHKKYSYIRKTRPDGNCFYRAFGFAHLESLLDDSKELQKWVSQWSLLHCFASVSL